MPEPRTCSQFQELVESFVDGESAAAEADFVRVHAAACATCREELARARELVRELRRLPPLSCPPRVTAAVLARAAAEVGEGGPAPAAARRIPHRFGGGWRRLSAAPAWGPALAAAAAAAFLSAALLIPRPATSPTPAMTAAELAEAQQEIKLAFAYIGRVGRQAGGRVADEMVDQVLAPTRQAFGLPPEGRAR